MSRVGRIRNHGVIPERRHDAFLLALLLALFLNVTFFAAQALIPKLAYLLQLLGAEPAATAPRPEEEESYPFVLVDPSFLDEEPDPNVPTEAEANLTRQARQAEAWPDLPELSPTITEGVEEILTAPDGNPGPAVSYQQAPGEQAPEQSQPDEEPSERQEEAEPQEPAESAEPQPESEPTPVEPPLEPPPVPEIPEPPISPPPEPPVETMPEPPAETPPEPEPTPEPSESEPEPPAEETPPEETATETPEPSPDNSPEPLAEIIDLAALPTSNEGLFDPETRRLEELARQRQDYPPPPIPRQPQFREPAEPERPVPRQAQPPRDRTGRRQPTFKQIGAGSPSSPSTAGGAPPRKRENSAVRVLDADASMALLAHRYGPYMEKLARQLQDSLFRQMILSPTSYSRGQVKVRFGISPDGTLTYYTTIFPNDGSMDLERILSERMLREAAPFDPLTAEMQQDENFQRMTVIVNLY